MTLSTSVPAREARLRRAMAREGRLLRKSRLRSHPHSNDWGGYQVVDAWTNGIVAGASFNLPLEDLEREWLDAG